MKNNQHVARKRTNNNKTELIKKLKSIWKLLKINTIFTLL